MKIGTKHMNILVTMSTGLTSNGLGINIRLERKIYGGKANNFNALYIAENIERFKEAIAQETEFCPPQDLNALHQLVSGFSDPSTYGLYRALAECLLPVHETLLPSTIFTLCDLPHNGNYGVSRTAATKIGSRFLSAMEASCLKDDFKMSRKRLQASLQMYRRHSFDKKTKQWKIVHDFAEKLEGQLKANEDIIDILQFAEKNVGSLAIIIGQALSIANKKITEVLVVVCYCCCF